MKQHRIIWYFTFAVALCTALFYLTRQTDAPQIDWPGDEQALSLHDLSETQIQEVIRSMIACLERDPTARRTNTRRVVEAVADLAENGTDPTAETFYALGLRLYGQRKMEEGKAAFRKAAALRPDWSWPHSGLGILLHAEDELEAAEQAFRKAIELDPGWSRPHNDLAILLRLVGRLDEAEREAEQALELDPDSLATHNNYGNLLVAQERYEEAQVAYEKAIELEPDHPAPYYNLACLASLRGDSERAVALLHCSVILDIAFRDQARYDVDFDAIRTNSDFRSLIYDAR